MNKTSQGWICGLVGVAIFSGSMPATKLAVTGFDPVFLTAARAALAAALGALCLIGLRAPPPARTDGWPLATVALCVVIGFPLLSAMALRHMTASRSILFLGLLPLATAVFGVLRGGERPRAPFWLCSAGGAGLVVLMAARQGGGGFGTADLAMGASVLLCGLGYAEGGALARRLGGWQVICWALLVAAPPMTLVALVLCPPSLRAVPYPAWLGLGYVTVFSMLVGFVFWYRGLALGGIAAVGQVQLLQPFLAFALAAVLLHEAIGWPLVLTTAGVALCVAGARRFAAPMPGRGMPEPTRA
ncbi:DMT family transporter [Gluconacetobacter tumulisoli]|uniref:DMT family transporter n=1 Tax=Gluconacetobacter tumulisoli TaxID=1286189 RepID=A0A7W4PMQ0_9PROT|nr:DMT family transporter [Gluconacetobacter tumulisoli]